MIEFNDSFTQVAVAQAMSAHSDLHRLITYQLTSPKWAHDDDETGKRTGPDKIKPVPTMHKTTLFVSPLDMVDNQPREINFAWWECECNDLGYPVGEWRRTIVGAYFLQPRHQRQTKLEQPHMSIFEHMTWGLGTPNLPKLGARAILQRGYVDFLGDRAGMYGEPDEAWRAECDTVLPHFLRELTKMAKAYQICTDMDEVFRLEHKGWVCEASPRRSYGYLYLDIYHPAN